MLKSEELKKIMIKGLRVNYACSCSKKVLRMLEGQAKEDLEDLLQDLELMNLEEKTVDEMYSHIRHFVYNIQKEEKSEISLIIDDDDEKSEIDKISYIKYINSSNYVEEQTVDINKLELTERQKEILNIYATTQSMSKTAEFLGISKARVQNTLSRTRSKLQKITA